MVNLWIALMKIFLPHRQSGGPRGAASEASNGGDPFDHPVIARFSLRELADMPFMRPTEISRAGEYGRTHRRGQ